MDISDTDLAEIAIDLVEEDAGISSLFIIPKKSICF